MKRFINFFSRLRKSKHASNEAKTDSSLLDQAEDVTDKNLQSMDDEEENVTKESNVFQSNADEEIRAKETNACKGKMILDKNKTNACISMNKNVEEAKEVNSIKNDDKITPDLPKQPLNDIDLTIEKVDMKSKSTDSQFMNLNTHQNKIDDNIELIQDEINNRQSIAMFPETLEATNANNINANFTTITNECIEKTYFNLVDSINSNGSSDIQNIKDQTTKCLNEFDKVLEEVEETHNAVDAESLSLEGIVDIILDEDLNIDDIFDDEDIDMENTNDIQEIRHITSDNQDLIFGSMTEIFDRKTSKSSTGDNIDVLSTSSHVTSTIVNEIDSTILQAIQNNITINSVEEINGTKEDGFLLQGNNDEAKSFVKFKSYEKTKDNKIISKVIGFEESKSSKEAKICEHAKNPEIINFDTIAYNQAENPAETKGFDETKGSEKVKRPLEPNSSRETKSSEETKILEANLDTISISSDECIEIIPIKSNKPVNNECGNHSSDFNFISEEEAKKDVHSNTKGTKRMHYDPYGPGTSSRNSGRYSYYSAEKQVVIDESHKENYEVPQEHQMVKMFRDMPGIPISEIHFLENKSLHVRVPMLVQYEGIGFDVSLALHEDSEDEDYRDEVKKTEKKIMEMYPAENKRKRRKIKRRR